jgi:hypothetical protein
MPTDNYNQYSAAPTQAEEAPRVPAAVSDLPPLPYYPIRQDMSANDAVRVVALIDRMLGDMGSVYTRAYAGSAPGYPPELRQLRRFLRDTQDLIHEANPQAFFK